MNTYIKRFLNALGKTLKTALVYMLIGCYPAINGFNLSESSVSTPIGYTVIAAVYFALLLCAGYFMGRTKRRAHLYLAAYLVISHVSLMLGLRPHMMFYFPWFVITLFPSYPLICRFPSLDSIWETSRWLHLSVIFISMVLPYVIGWLRARMLKTDTVQNDTAIEE